MHKTQQEKKTQLTIHQKIWIPHQRIWQINMKNVQYNTLENPKLRHFTATYLLAWFKKKKKTKTTDIKCWQGCGAIGTQPSPVGMQNGTATVAD